MVLDDFLEELEHEASKPITLLPDGMSGVLAREVFVRIDRGEDDRVRQFLMAIWATAIVRKDEGDYLLEYGAECGFDTPEHPDAGTDEANRQRSRIAAAAENLGLKLRKGKLEVV